MASKHKRLTFRQRQFRGNKLKGESSAQAARNAGRKFARRQCSPCCRRRATQTSDRVPFGTSRDVQTCIQSSRKTHNRTRDVRCLRCTPLFMFLLRTPEGYSACKCYWPDESNSSCNRHTKHRTAQ